MTRRNELSNPLHAQAPNLFDKIVNGSRVDQLVAPQRLYLPRCNSMTIEVRALLWMDLRSMMRSVAPVGVGLSRRVRSSVAWYPALISVELPEMDSRQRRSDWGSSDRTAGVKELATRSAEATMRKGCTFG